MRLGSSTFSSEAIFFCGNHCCRVTTSSCRVEAREGFREVGPIRFSNPSIHLNSMVSCTGVVACLYAFVSQQHHFVVRENASPSRRAFKVFSAKPWEDRDPLEDLRPTDLPIAWNTIDWGAMQKQYRDDHDDFDFVLLDLKKRFERLYLVSSQEDLQANMDDLVEKCDTSFQEMKNIRYHVDMLLSSDDDESSFVSDDKSIVGRRIARQYNLLETIQRYVETLEMYAQLAKEFEKEDLK